MAGIYRQWSGLQLCQVCQSASSSLLTLFGISASHNIKDMEKNPNVETEEDRVDKEVES